MFNKEVYINRRAELKKLVKDGEYPNNLWK